ncbi:MAG: hypothetical protein IIV23_09575, partial [Ruminococcus sp.]|nr:hypothetical protein [Ruminococcus sp.]
MVEERNIDYKAKKEELESIEAETAQQVAELEAKAAKAKEPIDERLLVAYNRIRGNFHNGLAVDSTNFGRLGGVKMAFIVSGMTIATAFAAEPISSLLPEMP